MKTPTAARRRILLHFFLGIALPGLLLGYLAYRGIRNDQALIEQQRRNEHLRIAAQIAASVDERLEQLEQSFSSVVADRPGRYNPDALPFLDSLQQQEPLIEAVFFLEPSGALLLPTAHLLFAPEPASRPPAVPMQPAALPSGIRAGRNHEFRQNDYPRALAAYQEAFSRASDDRVRGELLNAVARVQAKSGLFREAAASYERLWRDFGRIRMESGIPFGAAARLELGSSFLATGDSLKAVHTLTYLYESLVRAEWVLTEAQFDFFSRRVRETLTEILAPSPSPPSIRLYRDTVEILSGEEAAERARTERLLAFREVAGSALLRRLAGDRNAPPAAYRRFTLGLGGHTYLGAYLSSALSPGGASGSQTDGRWGFLLDSEALRADLLAPLIRQYASSAAASWLVRGREGGAVLSSDESPTGSPTIRTGLAGSFPPWSLEFYQRNPRVVETFLTSRRGIYFYAFLLLAGMLVFGLTLTIRTVTHQLELARMKSDFVSTISHEFKSPLTAIRQLAEMLKTNRVPSEERRQRYYDVLLEQSERLSLLIDNVLDFARMEEGRHELELEAVDAGDLLEGIVTMVQHRVRHDGFAIRAEIEDSIPPVTLDGAAITQATNNLIDNAIKYSGESKQVVVRGFAENQHLVIAVQDFGIGLSEGEAEKVFERFYRGGDELTRTVKGTGLGLTLVNQIVEAHGGRVEVESRPGRGSTFSMKLPLYTTASAGDGEDPSSRG